MKRALRLGFVLLILLALLLGVMKVSGRCSNEYSERTGDAIDALRPEMDVELLTVNPYSRPGTSTQKITGIVVHYTANPGATAMENRNYFENLKDTHETKASSNFVVGIEGEIVQCVPTWEVAYASNSRNIDTVSIECCHPDETGKFTDATYRSVVNLCAWLCMMNVSEMELLAPSDAPELRQYQNAKTLDFSSGTGQAKLYTLVVADHGELKKVVFEPNETIIEGFFVLAPRKVIRK